MLNHRLTKGKQIALYSVCTAIIALSTFVTKMPMIAVAGGYINFGDTFIFIFGCIFGPLCAMVSGAVGSALADLIAGFVVWSPFTLVIKGLEGLICGLLCRRFFLRAGEVKPFFATISFSVSAIVMIIGYYFAAAIILNSLIGAAAGILENLIQGSVSTVLALVILYAFRLIKFKPF